MKKGILRILFTNARVQYFLFTIGLAMPCFFMAYTEPLAWYSRILQVVFGVSFFLSVMAVKRRPSRSLYINFIFAFFGCFQLALLYLYGNSPVAVDMFLNTISTNANEAGELLGNLLLGVIMSCGLYISILLLGLASWHRQVKLDKVWHRHFRRMVALPLFVVSTSAAVLLQLFTPFRISVDLYPVNVTYNFGVAIYRFFQLKNYKYNTPNFMFESQATHEADEQETYMLIVGETARSINWGLYGYERQTTPKLAARHDLLVFRNVLSQSNTTHKCVPLLLTAAEAANPNPMYDQRSVLQAFKEAGFHTIYISNQAENGSLIDQYSREADVRRYVRDNTSTEMPDDANLLKTLRSELANDTHTKRLVIIHCYGSHFKYCERVPESYRVFQPCEDKQLKARNREDLINAFDNTMLYNDMIVDSLMTIVDEMSADTSRAQSVFTLFASDHGEDIYDDERENFLHASPVVSFYQMAVPFVAWANETYYQRHPAEMREVESHTALPVSPCREIFHTLIGAAGIQTPVWQADHSLCNAEFRPGERLYLNDRNEPVRVKDLHLTEGDFEQFRKWGISYE